MLNWLSPVSTLIDKVAGYFQKRQNDKALLDQARTKMQAAKQQGVTNVLLTDAESEVVLARGLNDTWKDEYGLILATSPILIILVGTIVMVFTGDERLLQAGNQSIKNLNDAGVDMEFIINAAFCLAFGYKVWRKK